MVSVPRITDTPGATAGPYLTMIDSTPGPFSAAVNDGGDLETPSTPARVSDEIIATALDTHSAGGDRWIGVFLAIGLAVAGYTDGLNSIISLGTFVSQHCTTHSLSPVRTVTSCVEIDAHWFRLAFLLGSALGPLLGGFVLADRVDRRWTILAGALVSAVGSVWAIAVPRLDHVQPILARGVQGAGVSLLAFAIPLLLVEIAAKKSRGFFGGVLFLGFYVGVFAWAITRASDGAYELRVYWQGLYLIPLILSVIVGIGAVTRCLLETYTLKRVAIAFVLLAVQQFFALASLAQLSDLFEDFRDWFADNEIDTMTKAEMLNTGFNTNNGFVAAVVAIPALIALCLVDKSGRRGLLLVGAVVLGAGQLGAKLFMDTCRGETFQHKCDNNSGGATFLTLLAIALYGTTWGPVCVIYPFELFPTEVRARGTAVAFAASTALVLLIREFYVELCFNTVALVVIPLLGLAVVALWCPETKRLALEDTEKLVAARGLGSLN
ncbi:hypothetical protein PybrP1_005224 [[Pythium] brassicae (nom. inval.)]|nr:hypothetical protein PybrP1_005224 [[Pythium] brassicae (nom. inval.)]